MLRNYFFIAVRTLRSNKVFTAINVLGLSIGISACLVIYLLVNYHLTFDEFEKDKGRIYRVVSNFEFSGTEYKNAGVTMPMANAMRKELTGFEMLVPLLTNDGDSKISIPVKGKSDPVVLKKQKDIVFVDKNYFNLIPYQWIAGSAATSLATPYQMVLTVSQAALYFPTLKPAEVVGKKVILNDTVTTIVSGIVKDLSYNSSFSFKMFISWATLENTSLKPQDWNQWNNTNGASQLFVKLSAGTPVTTIERGIARLYKKYKASDPQDHSITTHTLQPLSEMHFNGDYDVYGKPVVARSTLYSLLLVGVLLLLLACINFINLTTAQASKRMKEIGVRKAIGASRKQLVVQFFNETLLLTFSATVLSVLLTPFILKAFSNFIPDDLYFDPFHQPGVMIFLASLIFFITLLAGFYPAMVLSRYNPVFVLKNQAFSNRGTTRMAWLRRSLTTAQFVIALVFIMGVLLVTKQISYTLNKDMGFKKDAIVTLQTNYYDTVQGHKLQLAGKLRAMPGVAMISLSTNPPSSNSTWSGTMTYKDGRKDIATDVQQKFADTNYLRLYNIKLLAGSNLRNSDTVNSFIINQTFLHILGFHDPQDAIGKNIEWSKKKIPIVGVVADFNQQSLHEKIKPLALGSWSNSQRTFNIALQPQREAGDWARTMNEIEKAWKGIYPNDDLEYEFVDASVAKYYDGEKNVSTLLMWCTGLMIFISCLGLLGLVIYTTTQRTKEIGVRKVLGATVLQIITLIAKEFILLVMLAFVIAAPIAYFGMYKWLQSFAYRTAISWWVFALSVLGMMFIALFTVSIRTIQSALANPIKSLRNE